MEFDHNLILVSRKDVSRKYGKTVQLVEVGDNKKLKVTLKKEISNCDCKQKYSQNILDNVNFLKGETYSKRRHRKSNQTQPVLGMMMTDDA